MSEVHYTVTELMTATADAIHDRLGGAVWVDGEISGPRESRGHYYFDLVDRDDAGAVVAKVSIALWNRTRQKVETKLRENGTVRLDEGVKVRIRGPLELWLPGGRLQLSMQDIDPNFTLEALESERERVLALLRAEGLLDRNARTPLPGIPHRIALITADESAAQADFMHSLEDSGISWEVLFIDSRVQGAGAERTVAAALLTAAAADVDLIALVRGGGSKLDLAVFDHELIARTIASSPIPVFTGIGHEIDTSVADVVAHTASKTPTACAESIVDLAFDVINRAEHAWASIARLATASIDAERALLSSHARRAALAGRSRLTIEQQRVGDRARRVGRAGTGALRAVEQRLALHIARRKAVDPVHTLARGWSITRTGKGRLVRSPSDVAVGDELVTTFADGSVRSTVTDRD